MKKVQTALILLVLLLLPACGTSQKETTSSPSPQDLYETIIQSVDLPEMADVTADYLEAKIGISEDLYEAAAYYIPMESSELHELIFVQAVDEAAAATVKEKLDTYLDYRESDAQNYQTELLPIIQAAEVRQDGLTVSLILSPQSDAILAAFPA